MPLPIAPRYGIEWMLGAIAGTVFLADQPTARDTTPKRNGKAKSVSGTKSNQTRAAANIPCWALEQDVANGIGSLLADALD